MYRYLGVTNSVANVVVHELFSNNLLTIVDLNEMHTKETVSCVPESTTNVDGVRLRVVIGFEQTEKKTRFRIRGSLKGFWCRGPVLNRDAVE